MHRRLAAYAVLAIALAIRSDEARAAGCKDQTPTSWNIVVAPAKEPGERLVVEGRVLNTMSVAPLTGITVYVYHADSTGNYARSRQDKEPRLCGILRTNAKGEYRFETSMPGGYDGSAPHIHFEIWGPRVQRQYAFVNLERREGPMDSDRMIILPGHDPVPREYRTETKRPVYRGPGGKLYCKRDLLVTVK